MKKPLVVGVFRDRDAEKAFSNSDYELLSIPTQTRMMSAKFPRSPRLFVIETAKGEVDKTRTLVIALRRESPLTDVLLWAPQATGAAVRAFFQAGAKDVVLSQSPAKLAECVDETLKNQQFLPRVNDLSQQRSRASRFESMLSRSVRMWDLFELCTRVAHTDATVLIVGETGTGKELLARAVHRCSGRQGRFVAANCASIPPDLINSELFGHEKGAFTGADRAKNGLVLHANHGTLFLDEIGDMSTEAQQSLLRMLQEKRIRPVGSQVETEIDVRIVAATNVLLDQAVQAGNFREDLFYRLDVIRMNVPPLRERPEDILFLFGHFTKRLARHYGLDPPTFSEGFLDALVDYEWPGNVRQLENVSERLVLARPQRALSALDFVNLIGKTPAHNESHNQAQNQATTRSGSRQETASVDASASLQDNVTPVVEHVEVKYLRAVLRQTGGRIADAANRAGISRRTLLRKMKLHGIDKQEFKS